MQVLSLPAAALSTFPHAPAQATPISRRAAVPLPIRECDTRSAGQPFSRRPEKSSQDNSTATGKIPCLSHKLQGNVLVLRIDRDRKNQGAGYARFSFAP